MEISVISVLISGLYAIQASALIDVVTPDGVKHKQIKGMLFHVHKGQSIRIDRR